MSSGSHNGNGNGHSNHEHNNLETGDSQPHRLRNTSSFVSLTGVIQGEVKHSEEQGLRFVIKSEHHSSFYIKGKNGFSSAEMETLKPGCQVLIWGTLCSNMSRECYQHHIYVQPHVIVTMAPDRTFSVLRSSPDNIYHSAIFSSLIQQLLNTTLDS